MLATQIDELRKTRWPLEIPSLATARLWELIWTSFEADALKDPDGIVVGYGESWLGLMRREWVRIQHRPIDDFRNKLQFLSNPNAHTILDLKRGFFIHPTQPQSLFYFLEFILSDQDCPLAFPEAIPQILAETNCPYRLKNRSIVPV